MSAFFSNAPAHRRDTNKGLCGFTWHNGDYQARCIPQVGDNNRGPWEKAERFERELALDGREVYVIAGGVGSKTSFNSIDVPEFTWKIIVALDRGKSFPDGQEKAQVFAMILPNNDEDIEQDDRWQEYQTNVPQVEKKTGYRFF